VLAVVITFAGRASDPLDDGLISSDTRQCRLCRPAARASTIKLQVPAQGSHPDIRTYHAPPAINRFLAWKKQDAAASPGPAKGLQALGGRQRQSCLSWGVKPGGSRSASLAAPASRLVCQPPTSTQPASPQPRPLPCDLA